MIRLERSVAVHTFDVQGTVALGRQRPEFLAVARLAADLGRPLTGRDIALELLGLSEQVGWRVLERSVALGLLEHAEAPGTARLSARGAVALEHGSVLVAEEGTWRFYVIEDPLVDAAVVHVAACPQPHARAERERMRAAKSQRGAHSGSAAPTPAPIRRALGAQGPWTSIANGRNFEVRDVAPSGSAGPEGALRLSLQWPASGDPVVMLRGALGHPGGDGGSWPVDRVLDRPAALEYTDYRSVWSALAAAGGRAAVYEVQSWEALVGEPVLPVAFDAALPDVARQAMRMDLLVPASELPGLGRFEPTKLDGVRLVPRTEDDARRWAEWLQWAAIREYTTPGVLHQTAQQICERFPFDEVKLRPPGELLRHAKKNPQDPGARFLLAPADLGLWR